MPREWRGVRDPPEGALSFAHYAFDSGGDVRVKVAREHAFLFKRILHLSTHACAAHAWAFRAVYG